MTKISIVIKALNEQENIARAVESSLKAVAPFEGEVVVADCGSKDRTVEFAMRYPVRIVQLQNFGERCCGIAPQLGYQHATGEYVYILDGDMEVDAEFIKSAIEFLDREPGVAGVGGFIPEMRAQNIQFKARMKRAVQQRAQKPRETSCLSGGGLYRRSSIECVGYFSDRNLIAYEEYDLGSRLRQNGWRLVSLPMRAADHYSYSLGTLGLIWHKFRSGSFVSQGQIVRAAMASGYFPKVYWEIFALRITSVVWLYWLIAFAMILFAPYTLPAVGAAVFGLLAMVAIVSVKHGSVVSGLHSVAIWHMLAVCAIPGLMRSRQDPRRGIDSRVLKEPAPGSIGAVRSAAE